MAMQAEADVLVVSIEQMARILGVGLSTGKAMVARGDVGSFKEGRRRLVPMAEVRRYIERRMQEIERERARTA
jgi:excisionase family DNA binding protein